MIPADPSPPVIMLVVMLVALKSSLQHSGTVHTLVSLEKNNFETEHFTSRGHFKVKCCDIATCEGFTGKCAVRPAAAINSPHSD